MARNGSAEAAGGGAAAGSPPLVPAESGARLPPLPAQSSYTSSRQPYSYGYGLGEHPSFSPSGNHSSSLPGSLGGLALSHSHGAGSTTVFPDLAPNYAHLPGSPGLVSPATPSGLLPSGLKRPRSERPEEEAEFSDDNGDYITSGNQQQQQRTEQHQQQQQSQQQQSNEPSDQDDEKGGNGRLLKQTKRAAQNRAAQQAFRKRKEERIKELEDKEKQLAICLQREKEVLRREKDVYEREQRLIALEQHASYAGSTSALQPHPPPQPTNGHTLSATSPEDTKSFQFGSVAPESQDLSQDLQIARAEVADLQRQLAEKAELCATLNMTIEHMGAQNRLLRGAVHNPNSHHDEPADKPRRQE